MKIVPERRLFWFLKEGVSLDLEEPSQLDAYVQQMVTRGRQEDVKRLLRMVSPSQLAESLKRLKHFLPAEVRMFWEDFLGGR